VAGLFGGGEHSTVVGQQSAGYLALGADFEGGLVELPASGLLPILLPRVPGAINAQGLQAWREQRTLPLELDGRARELVVVELGVPDGWELVHLPAAAVIDNAVGRFVRTIEDDGDGGLTLRSELELKQAVVAADAWPDLRALLLEADAVAGRTLLLRQAEEAE
jgi:hypothetical protein